MNQEEFEQLASRVLAGEASTSEKQALDALVARNLDRFKEFEAIKVAHEAIRQGLPLVRALDAQAPELPPYRRNELQASVRAAFAKSKENDRLGSRIREAFRHRLFPVNWAWAGSAAAVLLVCLLLVPWGDHRRIEVGLYDDYATRGADRFPSLQQERDVDLKLFKKDHSFERWKKRPLSKNLKAQIWVDDERGFIRARWWNARGRLQEINEAMPDDARQQEHQLRRLIATIQRESNAR